MKACKFDSATDMRIFIDEELNITDTAKNDLINQGLENKKTIGIYKIYVDVKDMK